MRNASTTWVNSTSWQLDSTVTATCDADHLVAIGDTDFVITCNETGWQHEAACYEGEASISFALSALFIRRRHSAPQSHSGTTRKESRRSLMLLL